MCLLGLHTLALASYSMAKATVVTNIHLKRVNFNYEAEFLLLYAQCIPCKLGPNIPKMEIFWHTH